ncbi:hypothetical protein [Streptomyces canus]|uniref:hypothetical protein n=1 Tax=Streptomyces canus TaxID=58343 RepID=UPI000746A393|nr:hypothetical protein [Streptomyces canus]KUN03237.1 hypothetical protein AQI96_38600 [Streptomyces canus]
MSVSIHRVPEVTPVRPPEKKDGPVSVPARHSTSIVAEGRQSSSAASRRTATTLSGSNSSQRWWPTASAAVGPLWVQSAWNMLISQVTPKSDSSLLRTVRHLQDMTKAPLP